MDGFILRFSVNAVDYRSQAGSQMNCCTRYKRRQDTTRQPQQHALHLLKILEQNYEITSDWDGNKFTGIDIACNYYKQHANRT